MKGWDTDGARQVGRLTDGRFAVTFAGKADGAQKTIFIPAESLAPLIANLIACNAKTAKDFPPPVNHIPQHLIGVASATVSSDARGSEYVLSLVSGDGLEMRFHFDPHATETLATALVAALAGKGINVSLPKAGGTSH